MSVEELAKLIHARAYSLPVPAERAINRFHAADTMSDLIAHATPETLLVTSLNNAQLIRVAELMDVPGICLVSGAAPIPELLFRAKAAGTAILSTPRSLSETVQLLDAAFGGHRRGTP
jgi:hypothetical protein